MSVFVYGRMTLNLCRSYHHRCIGFDAAECRNNLDKIKYEYFLRRTNSKNSQISKIKCNIQDVKVKPNDMECCMYRQVFNMQRSIIINSDEHTKSFNILNGILKCRQAMIHPSLIQGGTHGSSSKFDIIKSKLLTHLDEKCIIFCHFKKEMVLLYDNIVDIYSKDKISMVNGDMSSFERDEQFHNFEMRGNVLIIQIKVGGVGLNLQHASHVYLTSPSWNPATDLQAIHRSYRTGQQKTVTVTRFFMEHVDDLPSIDLAILHLQNQKQELTNEVLSEHKGTNLLNSDSDIADNGSIKYFAKVFNSGSYLPTCKTISQLDT
mgnify:CR=1 FL=1